MNALEIVSGFDAGPDGLARNSRELTLGLLRNSDAPFSRDQFNPGHVTCTWLPRVLMMHHHRLRRWLLPGGHVEQADLTLVAAAEREAREETRIHIDPGIGPFLAGIDVHGIPGRKEEPYHLHHDLIWCFRAASHVAQETAEAPRVSWVGEADFEGLGVADSIRQSIRRAGLRA